MSRAAQQRANTRYAAADRYHNQQWVDDEKIDANVALATAQPAATHGVFVQRVAQPGARRDRGERAPRDAIQDREQRGRNEGEERPRDENGWRVKEP